MNVPQQVIRVVSEIFSQANRAATALMSRVPDIREGMLDGQVIAALVRHSVPVGACAGWTVCVQVDYLDKVPVVNGREVADFGILVRFSDAGSIVRQKAVLLQAKRLYPAAGARQPSSPAPPGNGRQFTRRSRFAELKAGSQQIADIDAWEKQYCPVFYLLYCPSALPFEALVPAALQPRRLHYTMGCRVQAAQVVHAAVCSLAQNAAPSVSDLCASGTGGRRGYECLGRRLEDFVSSVVRCEEGLAIDGAPDGRSARVLEQRDFPIRVAITVAIDGPARHSEAV